jgi:hypothetical protein
MQIGNQFIHFGISGRLASGSEEKHLLEYNGVPPRFGFNYWFWVPKLEIRKQNTISIYSFNWLCFFSYWDNYNLLGKN